MKSDLEASVVALVCLALFVLLALFILGCDRREDYGTRPEVTGGDPGGYEWGGLEGRWWRGEGNPGWAYLTAWDDSVIDCVARVESWGTWRYGSNEFKGDYFRLLAVFSLHVRPDSTLESLLRGVWMADPVGAYTLALPESLGAVVAGVTGRFTQADSFYAGQVYHEPDWSDSFVVMPGFDVLVSVAAPKLERVTVLEKLRRVGGHVD